MAFLGLPALGSGAAFVLAAGLAGAGAGAASAAGLVFFGRSLTGSLIGGIAETQEMLDFCAAKNITADIELIDIKDVNTVFERMEKSDVKYRFVIDMATL